MAIGGGLKQAVVQDVTQRLGEGAQHLLLGLPHRRFGVEPQTLLENGQLGTISIML